MTQKTVKVDLGVLDCQNGRATAFREKPEMKFLVSMGIYCMEPQILEQIPKEIPFGFDDLMYAMLEQDLPVSTYKHDGFWMDIGREQDFKAAQKIFQDTDPCL